MKRTFREITEGVEQIMVSLGDPEAKIGTQDEMKYVVVGTDIDSEEFQEYVSMTIPTVAQLLVETDGHLGSILHGMVIQTLLVGYQLGVDADK